MTALNWRPVLVYVTAIGLLSSAALFNGYPLVFSDSGTYVDSSFGLKVPLDRPGVYGAVLILSHWKTSLWLPILLQGAIVVFVIDCVVAAVLPRGQTGGSTLPILAGLTVGSSLPWFTSQLMPDVLTGVLVLSLFLLLFCEDGLPAARRRGAQVLFVLAVAVHFSHIALGLGLVLGACAWSVVLRPTPRIKLGGAAGCLGLSIVLSVLFNLARTGEPFLFSRVSHVFLMGRLVQDGLIQRLLDEHCDERAYALCRFRDRLVADANHYIWSSDSPIHAIGGFVGSAEESRRMIRDTIVAYHGAVVAGGLHAAVEQLVRSRTGDGLGAYDESTRIGSVVRRRFPSEASAYFRSRQQQGALWGEIQGFADVHQLVLWACLFMSPALAVFDCRRGRDRLARLHALIWIALIGNAAITGFLSTVADRYQARIAWLLPLAVLLSVQEAIHASRVASPCSHDGV